MNTTQALYTAFIVALVLILGSCSSTISSTETVIENTHYTTGILENGMTYYIYPTDVVPDQMELRVIIKTGSLYEEEHELGLSHFLEHLAFNSTEKYTREEMQEISLSLGIGSRSHVNGYTTFDEVGYFLPLQDLTPHRIETLFDLMSQRTLHITITPEEVEAERGVILAEKRERSASKSYKQYMFQFSHTLAHTPYPNHLPIGTEERIKNATVDELQHLFDKWYIPSRMAVIVSGDITPEEIDPYLHTYFGSVRSEKTTADIDRISTPNTTGVAYYGYHEPTNTYNKLFINKVDRHRNTKLLSDFRDSIVRRAVQEYFRNTFDDYLRYKKFDSALLWTYFTKNDLSYLSNIAIDTIAVGIQEGKIEEGITEMQFFIENFSSQLKTEEGIARIYQKTETIIDETINSSIQYLPYYGELLSQLFIDDDAIFIDEQATAQKYKKKILASLSTMNIAEEIDSFYDPNNIHTFLFVGKEDAHYIADNTVIRDLDLGAVLNKTQAKPVSFSKENIVDVDIQSLVEKPNKKQVIKEEKDEAHDIYTWTLDNGIVVKFKETAPRNPGDTQLEIFGISGFSNDGIIKDNRGIEHISDYASQYVLVDDIPFVQLTEELSGVLSPAFININTNTTDYETLFQSIYLMYTQSSISEGAFNRAKYETILDQQESLTYANHYSFLYYDTLRQAHSENFTNMLEDTYIQEVNYQMFMNERTRDLLHKNKLFIIAGNTTPQKTKQFVEQWIATIPTSDVEYEVISPIYPIDSFDTPHIVTRKDVDNTAIIMHGYYNIYNHKSFVTNKSYLLASILSEYIKYELEDKIREELGNTYGVSANVRSGSSKTIKIPYYDESLFITFQSNPEKAEESYRAMNQILQNILPIDEEKLERVKTAQVSYATEAYKHDIVSLIALQIAKNFFSYVPFADNPEAEIQQIQAINKKDVETMFTRILNGSSIGIITYPNEAQLGVPLDDAMLPALP